VLGNLGSGLDPHVERRVTWLFLAVIAAFSIFGLRLFQLQVIQGEAHRLRSERNRIRTVRLEAPRGDILDREGRPIATTRAAFELQAIPAEVRRPETTWPVLAELVGADADALRERVGQPRGRRRFQPVSLVGDLSRDALARVESHRYALPGVTTDVRPHRLYVDGDLAPHLLGTLGEVRESQLATRAFADYRAGEVVGQSGIEALAETHLRGRAGGRNVVVDVAGREVEVLEEVEPRPGGNVVLTLDWDLQAVARAAFRRESGGHDRAGAVVALDPRNGDVLVLISSPGYDPNDFVGGIDTATWRSLNEDPRRPLHDRVLSGQYPPGSTYKPIVAAAALEEGIVGPDTRVFCPGHWKLGRRTYRCWKRAGHGWVDLDKALVESCDVFFYEIGRKLGIDRIAYFARGFGLGRKPGLGLPQEKAGLVPTTAWKLARRGEPWIEGETISAAIGQGYNLVTPLQLAVATAALANGGTVVRPRIVLRRTDRDGHVVEETPVEVRSTAPVALAYLEKVRDHLVGVVQGAHGTGRASAVPGLEVAGKTGTAQVVGLQHTEDLDEEEIAEQHRDHAWFVAWAPAREPEIAVTVLMEHGGHGGSAAAPVAGKILRRWWEKKQAPPEPEGGPAPADAPPEGIDLGPPGGTDETPGGTDETPGGVDDAPDGPPAPVVTAEAPEPGAGEGERAAN
jgi:penicillin-binding protein 2